MNDHEMENARQLTDELQIAALRLIKHLGTNNFRILVEGTTPAVYITLSEGRNSYSAESINFQGPRESPLDVAHARSPFSYFARLRKVLAA